MVVELARIETPRFALDDLLHHREFVFIAASAAIVLKNSSGLRISSS